MSSAEKAPEPSMDDIINSIRNIIADDTPGEVAETPVQADKPQIVQLTENQISNPVDQPVLDAVDAMPAMDAVAPSATTVPMPEAKLVEETLDAQIMTAQTADIPAKSVSANSPTPNAEPSLIDDVMMPAVIDEPINTVSDAAAPPELDAQPPVETVEQNAAVETVVTEDLPPVAPAPLEPEAIQQAPENQTAFTHDLDEMDVFDANELVDKQVPVPAASDAIADPIKDPSPAPEVNTVPRAMAPEPPTTPQAIEESLMAMGGVPNTDQVKVPIEQIDPVEQMISETSVEKALDEIISENASLEEREEKEISEVASTSLAESTLESTAAVAAVASVATEAVAGPDQENEGEGAGPNVAGGRSLEDSVKEMLKPMIREWLNDNMPRILEGIASEEVGKSDKQE